MSREDVITMAMRFDRGKNLPDTVYDKKTATYQCPKGYFETASEHRTYGFGSKCFPEPGTDLSDFWKTEDYYSVDLGKSAKDYYSLTSETRNAFLYSYAFVPIADNKRPYLHTPGDCISQGGIWIKDDDTSLTRDEKKYLLPKEKPHHLSTDTGLCVFHKSSIPEFVKAAMITDEGECKKKGYSWTNNIFDKRSCYYKIKEEDLTNYLSPHPGIDDFNDKFVPVVNRAGGIIGDVVHVGGEGLTLLEQLLQWTTEHPYITAGAVGLIIAAPLLTDIAILSR